MANGYHVCWRDDPVRVWAARGAALEYPFHHFRIDDAGNFVFDGALLGTAADDDAALLAAIGRLERPRARVLLDRPGRRP